MANSSAHTSEVASGGSGDAAKGSGSGSGGSSGDAKAGSADWLPGTAAAGGVARRPGSSEGTAYTASKGSKEKTDSDDSDGLAAENAALRESLAAAKAQVQELEDTITLLSTSLQMMQQQSAGSAGRGSVSSAGASHPAADGGVTSVQGTLEAGVAQRSKRRRTAPVRHGDMVAVPVPRAMAAAPGDLAAQAPHRPPYAPPSRDGSSVPSSLRTASASSASGAGEAQLRPRPQQPAGAARVKGKMSTTERGLVDAFVDDVKEGRVVVPKGSLARMLQAAVNPSRHITFFEKLVSRRRLNQELAPLFAPREPRPTAAVGGAKRKRPRRRPSAKETLMSLLDNPELLSLVQAGLLPGAPPPPPPPAGLLAMQQHAVSQGGPYAAAYGAGPPGAIPTPAQPNGPGGFPGVGRGAALLPPGSMPHSMPPSGLPFPGAGQAIPSASMHMAYAVPSSAPAVAPLPSSAPHGALPGVPGMPPLAPHMPPFSAPGQQHSSAFQAPQAYVRSAYGMGAPR